MKIAIINPQTNIVENVAVAPEGSNVWFAPHDKIAIESEEATIGDTYQDGQFIKPQQED